MRFAAFLAILLLLLACSKSIPRRELPSGKTPSIRRVVLSDKLGVKEVREIFDALNADGSLNALAPYIKDAPEQAVQPVADLLTRYVYREVDTPQALIPLLRSHIASKDLSHWAKAGTAALSEPSGAREANALLFLLRQPEFPELGARASAVLDPSLVRSLMRAMDSGACKAVKGSKGAPVEPRELLTDLFRLSTDTKLKDRLDRDLQSMAKHHFGWSAMRALSHLHARDEHQSTLGFARGVQRLLHKETSHPTYANQLDLFFAFCGTMARDSKGLIPALARSLTGERNSLRGGFALFLEATAAKSAAGFVRRELEKQEAHIDWAAVTAEPPSKEFNRLLERVRTALTPLYKVAPKGPVETDENRLNLVSYGMTRWLDRTVRGNADVLKGVAPAKLWETKVKSAPFAPIFYDQTAKGKEFPLDGALSASSLAPWWRVYKQQVQRGPTPEDYKVSITFTATATAKDFKTLLVQAAGDAFSSTHSFSAESIAQVLAFQAAESPENSILSLGRLNPPNLLTLFNELARVLPLEELRALKDLLFGEELHVGMLEQEEREVFFKLFPGDENERHRALLSDIFDSVQMLYEWDRVDPDAPLPSPFELYRTIVRSVPTDDSEWIGTLARLLSEGRFFRWESASNREWRVLYPALYRVVSRPEDLSRALCALGGLGAFEAAAFRNALSQLFTQTGTGPSGLKQSLDLTARLLTQRGGGTRALLERVWQNFDLSSISDPHLAFFARFLGAGDLTVLWNYFHTHTTRPQALALVRTLRQLQSQGALRQAFGLLTYIQDSRLQRVGQFLVDFERSGELAPILEFLERLLEIPEPTRDEAFEPMVFLRPRE